jgi:signal transduction histidine kinase
VQDLEPLLSKAVGQNAELQLHMASSIWPISVDKLYFENSLINLCINARDATEEHGQITLTAENVLLKRASHAGDYVMISVADNGMGMSEEIKARIFDMFFTTKPEGKGAGLGLPMVKNFMDHVQGLIEVESTPGLGTIVSLYFPRTTGRAAEPASLGPCGPAGNDFAHRARSGHAQCHGPGALRTWLSGRDRIFTRSRAALYQQRHEGGSHHCRR